MTRQAVCVGGQTLICWVFLQPVLAPDHRVLIRAARERRRCGPQSQRLLPQLSVSSPTVTEAISRTEDTINAILAGRVGGFSDTEPKGA